MSKPLSKKSATILGTCLSLFGFTAIVMVLGEIKNPVAVVFVIIGAGCLSIGTWVTTVAKAMKDSDGEKPAKPSGDS